MKSLLRALYNGDFSPAEDPTPRSRDYEVLRQRLIKDLDQLMQQLPAEDAKRLQTFAEQRNQLAAMEAEHTFARAFACGARLMAEVYLTEGASPD